MLFPSHLTSVGAPVLLGALRPASQALNADKDSPASSPKSCVSGADKEATKCTNSLREPQENGNLFLTCLRLRFEERGSWSKALAEPHEQVDEDSVCDTPTVDEAQELASPSGMLEEVSSWRERVGFAPRGSTRALLQKLLFRRGSGACGQDAPLEVEQDVSSGLAFESVGRNLVTSVASIGDGSMELEGQVSRRPGAGNHCVAVTVEPLAAIAGMSGDFAGFTRSYYFEFEILDMNSSPTTQGLSLGFAWPPFREISGKLTLPEFASKLPRSFILGGEPPRAHLGGRIVGHPPSWRPLIHTREGSVVGALLEIRGELGNGQSLHFKIFQDGVQRCEIQELVPPDESWDCTATSEPHAVIDLCGNVRCVQVRRGRPPTAGSTPNDSRITPFAP